MNLPADDQWLLLHNPRCSKSRAALALLEERNIPFTVRRYLEEPLTREELLELEHRLGRPLVTFMRQQEQAFSAAGLSPDTDREALLEALVEAPVLLERPILVGAARATIGRPPEKVLELLSD